ncbi:MAG: hypothetical protein HY279_02495 [Nitrospinae bacterium]|nr:hypothetical protein [Nitrospinota bacterium]
MMKYIVATSIIVLGLVYLFFWMISFFRRIFVRFKKKDEPASLAGAVITDSAQNASTDAIWAIRDSISRLEEAKNKVVALFGSEFPSVDAKEAYFGTVTAWELLEAASGERKGNTENSRRARWALETAKSRALQCASALKGYENLQIELSNAFDACYREISAALDAIAPRQEEKPPNEIIVKKSADEYQLLCSVCGAVSWILKKGKSDDGKDWIQYKGISSGMGLNAEDSPVLFDLLAQGNLADVHRHIYNKYVSSDVMGIDAYCPECKTIYCARHYNVYETYDEGFYDETIGTCPKGHRRKLND